MALLEDLSDLGADTNDALKRFMGNRELQELLMKEIPPSVEANGDVAAEIDAGNIEGAIQKAHTLKGNMGNLSITPLYKAYTEITNLLRAGEPDKAKRRTEEIRDLQNKIVETIKGYM